MRFLKYLFLLISTSMFSQITVQLKTPFEKGNGNQTTTFQQCINYYQNLDADFETIKVIEMGLTDSGEKLQVILFDKDKKVQF